MTKIEKAQAGVSAARAAYRVYSRIEGRLTKEERAEKKARLDALGRALKRLDRARAEAAAGQ